MADTKIEQMTVKNIVAEFLKAHGFDGLCNDDCGCDISDLNPCGECFYSCVPAKFVECVDCQHFKDKTCDGSESIHWGEANKGGGCYQAQILKNEGGRNG